MIVKFKNHLAFLVPNLLDKTEQNRPEIKLDSLVPFLQHQIELEEDTLLKDIFRYLEFDESIYCQIFKSILGGFSLSLYLKEARHESTEEIGKTGDGQDMQFLEAFWEVVYTKWKNEVSFDISPGFHGKGTHLDEKGHRRKTGFGIEFMPLNNLVQYPVRINEEVVIRLKDCDQAPQKFAEPKKAQRTWTVYDLFCAILSEISFMGSPLERSTRLAELDQRCSESKNLDTEQNQDS